MNNIRESFGYGVVSDYRADTETLNAAQKYADNQGLPVYVIEWTGKVVQTIEPEV